MLSRIVSRTTKWTLSFGSMFQLLTAGKERAIPRKGCLGLHTIHAAKSTKIYPHLALLAVLEEYKVPRGGIEPVDNKYRFWAHCDM